MNRHQLTAVAAIAVGSLFAADTFAVPYASGIRNTTGTTYEFILNEASTDVTIDRSVGGSLALGALAAGRHTFDLGAAATYDLKVSGSSAAGYNAVDDTANSFTHFDRPGGLVVNSIPTSPYFGTVYVNQGRSVDGFTPILTGSGRPMGNGIYSLTADRQPVELTDFSIPTDPNDVSLAKSPAGFTVNQGNSNSLYRIALDDGGNLIGSDWSDSHGGLKYISPDLTAGAVILNIEGGPAGGNPDGLGLNGLHGSINGQAQVISGTYGVDLVVAAMDEDLDSENLGLAGTDGNNVWRWNVGATLSNHDVAPSLEIAVGDLQTSTGGRGHATLGGKADGGTHSDGTTVFLDLPGVTANAQYNRAFDKWYLSGSRGNGDDSSSLVILTPEGPAGDGFDIIVDWASKQFSIDNNLDGFVDTTDGDEDPFSVDPNNDIFRRTHTVSFSPDNKTMFLQRRLVPGQNPVTGDGTPLGATILAIPLDANGVPDIQFDINGDISNIVPIFTLKDPGGGVGSYSAVEVDAAGNVFYSGNNSERLQYFSLGGDTVATTSGGTSGTTAFVVNEVVALLGDYNGNGIVDAADYTIYRDTLGDSVTAGTGADGDGDGNITTLDYTVWANNFGNTSPSNSSAVPEPTSLLLLAAGLMGLAGRRNRS